VTAPSGTTVTSAPTWPLSASSRSGVAATGSTPASLVGPGAPGKGVVLDSSSLHATLSVSADSAMKDALDRRDCTTGRRSMGVKLARSLSIGSLRSRNDAGGSQASTAVARVELYL